MSLRLFAALGVPDEIAERLIPLQKGVLGAKWRPRENLHVTLRFFGEIEEPVAEELDYELERVRVAPFELRLKGAGWFGGERPHSLWIGLEAHPNLTALAAGCEKAARRVGLAPEKRPFTPHVTLAYCAGTGPDDAAKFQRRHGLLTSEPFWVDRFHLYSSWQGKGPNLYVDEAEYPLQA